MALRTVRVPQEMSALFEAAEQVVSRYFAERSNAPERGTIEVHGERYVLVRAAALSVEFFGVARALYGEARAQEADEFARNILFDLAHAIGKSDARNLHTKMGLSEPIARMSAGPVHFAYTGWALVEISPESRPAPDESFYLLYDHPYSFEASAWQAAGNSAAFPVCVMNAGYSSGWCEESFGIPLLATEISCRARGDDVCRFVMAHPNRIEEHVSKFRGDFQIPDFFARKRMEEELRQSRDELEVRVAERTRELREANELLLQAQKLEAVGRLAGGIAHDFNNLLGMVLMRASLLQSRVTKEDPAWRELDQIRHACERGGALSRQLLAFSKRQRVEKRPLELGQLLRELARTLLPLVGEDIEVTTQLVSEAHIEGDRSQMEQVLMNLVVNARDAMPGGGTLTLTVDVIDTPARRVTTGPLPMARYATLAVSDTGAGMDAETLARIFDPYFTTKPERGTGLGLSTVYGIVEQSDGGIDVASVPGRGSTFTLYLPASSAQPALARTMTPPMVSQLSPCRILLVEDEPQLRETLHDVLQGSYDVVSSDGALSALEVLDRAKAPFDILLTDLVMPRMGGRELARKVRDKWPRVQILFMSGYDREHFVDGKSDLEGQMLHKPFTLEELLRRIEELASTRS
ncbi:MAG: response regulator [Deltaproteobacteria bacterium]|nr:response regulator [Deltaproteobacteria bacterium]